jgi:hypothetical protein
VGMPKMATATMTFSSPGPMMAAMQRASSKPGKASWMSTCPFERSERCPL